MPTPLDAPYKLEQAEATARQRAAKRTARIDRKKLMQTVVRTAAAVKRGDQGAARRLHSLWCMLTPQERMALTGRRFAGDWR